MRMSMLLGAIIGFTTAMAVGLLVRNTWPVVLWHASASALVLGFLARWWASIWQSSLRQVVSEQIAKNELQRKQANQTPTPKKT